MRTCVRMCMFACVCACIRVHVYVYMCIYIQAYVPVLLYLSEHEVSLSSFSPSLPFSRHCPPLLSPSLPQTLLAASRRCRSVRLISFDGAALEAPAPLRQHHLSWSVLSPRQG